MIAVAQLGSVDSVKPASVAGSSSSEDAKIRRDHTRSVELQRQMRGIALEHAVSDLTLRILDQKPALRPLDKHDQCDTRR